MLSKNEDTKISNIRYIPSNSKYITSNRLKSGIQSIQSRFKLIEFNNMLAK